MLLAFNPDHSQGQGNKQQNGDDERPKIRKEIRQDYRIEAKGAKSLHKQVETEFDIYGKIVQYTEFDVLPEGKTSLNRQTIHKYNSDGKRIGTMVYDLNNMLLWSEEHQLDAQGRTIKTTQTDHSKASPQRQISTHEYDQYGNEAVTRTFNGAEASSEKRRTYNASGEMLLLQHWYYHQEKDGKIVKRSVRTENLYNSQGHLVKSISDVQEGKRKWREIRHFENCAIVECDKYENGKLISHYRRQDRDQSPNNPAFDVVPIPNQPFPMEYDDKERDVLASFDHTEMRTITLKTDKNGNLTKRIIREHGDVYSVTYYTYNDENQLTKEHTLLKSDNSTDERRYEYDQYGNITRELHLKNDETVEEFAIIYEYYNN